ncbi:hypothetical protein DEU56DRAFT_942500 [Suillus clintonianus]|uniref:uncharacterized protein n=1 Tax=Suillus clintonianus TaxID=1904413 RepID=UPI001B87DFC0|nr:uncharacterized protein DEU56DRAFT_942500 [Suillus clintonianus]KAG2139745.1 hypothetical protein DEU56DRAFT_942500 [Suillus clintonianus]
MVGSNIQRFTDELFQHAKKTYPSEKMAEFRKSVDAVASTLTALHQVVKGATDVRGIPIDSVLKEIGGAFCVLFTELKEQFPPPGEAPGHEKRMIMINTVLDRFEEIFLPVAIKYGATEELLKNHTSSLKSSVRHIVVTIGDIHEQHPELAWTLSSIATGTLAQGLIVTTLRIFGLGASGPVKGTAAAWLQAWFFGAAVPRRSWFAVLQRLTMRGAKL